MFYLQYRASCAVNFFHCGFLENENGFTHHRQNIDRYDLIVMTKGTLYVSTGKEEIALHENEFVLLPPFVEHFGTRKSSGRISYCWVHFRPDDPQAAWVQNPGRDGQLCVIPMKGMLAEGSRTRVLLRQLLDAAVRDRYESTPRCRFACSLMLLELSEEAGHGPEAGLPLRLYECLQWIRLHHSEQLSVGAIAERFGYNPSYLAQITKKYTGQTITEYLNGIRIASARQLLTYPEYSIEEVANLCGFADVKYFYRVFRRFEEMTPGEYRRAFYRRRISSR